MVRSQHLRHEAAVRLHPVPMKKSRRNVLPAPGRKLPVAKRAADMNVLSLRGGPVSLRFDPTSLWVRHLMCGDIEVLRGVYPAARDTNWGTPQPAVSWLDRRIGRNDFHLEIEARYGGKSPAFVWRLTLDGSRDGTVVYSARGTALRPFPTNRAGFCVLHPPGVAGKPCQIESVDGAIARRRFPAAISPHQPFFDVRAMTHAPASGVSVTVRMEGDTFETEDQRNWTDASFKTYCRPLALPFPYTLRPGADVEQRIEVQVSGPGSAGRLPAVASSEGRAPPASIELRAGGPRSQALPQLGVLLAGRKSLSAAHVRTLRAANIRPVRVDGDASSADFVDFNRTRRIAKGSAFAAISLDAQVHAFDEASIAETTSTYALNVAQARRIARNLPIAVTPLRFGAPRTGQPPRPDPRQRRAFGGVWMLASLAALVEGRAHSVTFEPELLLPRTPAFAVLQACVPFARATPLRSTRPHEACGLALSGTRGEWRILVGNFAAEPRRLRLRNPPPGTPAAKLLFHENSSRATRASSIARARASATVTLPAHAVLQLDFPPRR